MKFFYSFIILFSSSFSLLAQDTFQGTVESESGMPLFHARVAVYDSDDNILATEFTNEEGKFNTDLSIGRVTGIDDAHNTDEYLSLLYPNPMSEGPVHFKYRSKRGRAPKISFYTFKGEEILQGTIIHPGTYIYKAAFSTSEEKGIFTGLFSVLRGMTLEVDINAIIVHNSAVGEDSNASKVGRKAEEGSLRVEIIKDEFITLNEELDISSAGSNKIFSLTAAPKPTADFEIIASDGMVAGGLIKFNASASQGANEEELNFTWSFGDGTLGGQPQIAHIFNTEATYYVDLTVTGTYGAKSSISKEIQISDVEVPTGKVAIRGVISDISGNTLENVEITVPHLNSTFITNASGEVGFDGFVSGKPQILEIRKEGYITEYFKLEILETARQGYFELSLIEREAAISIPDADLGGEAKGKDGAAVKLPVDGLVHEDGTRVSGTVEVYMTPVDISDAQEMEAFPGRFEGITYDGPAPLIMSYGTADFTFMQGGEKLQLAPGKMAEIDIPIYAAEDQNGEAITAGSEFPMWSYDEKTGVWVEEGMGMVVESTSSPTGFALHGTVSHFTWWNHDIVPEPWYAIPECKIKDKNGLPTLEIPHGGSCYINGRLEGPGGPRGNPSTPNCCSPLACPPGVPIIFAGTGGNGLYTGKVTKSGAAGTTTSFIISMQRIAGYGEVAGEIAPDTTFTTAIEEVGGIDAFTVNQQMGEKMLVSVGQANGSTLEGTVEIRDPDNLPIGKQSFNGSLSGTFILKADKTGDYQIIVDGTANEPGAYTLSLNKTRVLSLNSNTEDELEVPQGTKSFAFELDSGQLFNVAMVTSITGRLYLNLYNPLGERIFRKRGEQYIESGVRPASVGGVFILNIEGVDSDSDGEFTLGLSSIEDPLPLTIELPYTTVENEVTIIGDHQYYSFNDVEDVRKRFALHTPSSLAAYFNILKPDEGPFYKRSALVSTNTTNYNDNDAYRWGRTDIKTIPSSGEYILEVDPSRGNDQASKTGPYELYVVGNETQSIGINSQLDDDIEAFLGWINEFKQYTFEGTADQLINIAYTDDIPGRNYLRLFDDQMNVIKSIRDGQELGVMPLPYTGSYTIEFAGVDTDRSQGTFTLGLTSIAPPTPINFTSPFTVIDDNIDIVGRHRFYSMNVDSLERYNIGISLAEPLQYYFNLRKEEDKPFYSRNVFKNIYTSSYISGETDAISMPFEGELIFEVQQSLGKAITEEGYQIYIGRREVIPLDLNTPVTGTLSQDLGIFDQFYQYRISSPASNKISVGFTWDIPDSNRIYISIYTLEGQQLYRQRELSSSVITLPGAGDYIVEIESVDDPNDAAYNVIVNEE